MNKSHSRYLITRCGTIYAYLEDRLDTRELLVTWGIWARSIEKLGFTSYGALFNIISKHSLNNCVSLNPDEIELIDYAVHQLRTTSEKDFKLLCRRHIHHSSISSMARHYKMRTKTMSEQLRAAENKFHNFLLQAYADAAGLSDCWVAERRRTFL